MSSITALLVTLLFVAASYLMGSIPFAVVVSRLMGLKDPRTFGSGNPGATNVLRTGSKKAALLTLLGDALKGWLPVYLVITLSPGLGLSPWPAGLCAVAAFLGHVFPVFLNFKGGKGVATALGVLLALNPWLGLATLVTWIIVAYATRYSSLSSIVSAVFAPLYYLLGANVAWPMNGAFIGAITVICVVLLFRHSANISRLLQGKESKIGSAKK
jgi:glycerol-3-phosphate acyltransferase PlsY